MTNNMNTKPSNRDIFIKISKKAASSYLLDYVTQEFEAIISCPSTPTSPDYFSSSKRAKSNNSMYNKSSRAMSYETSGLPSPPLSSPERKALSKNNNINRENTTTTSFPTPASSNTVSLRFYIESVVKRSRIDTGTLLSSLAYARRLKSKLSQTSKGMECTHHRIFLATLIIASKYIHDSALKNKYWVGYAQMFSASEINLMEKQLLQLLDYNLEIKSEDYNLIMNDISYLYRKHKIDKELAHENNIAYWTSSNQKHSLVNPLKPSPPLYGL